jgi:hypothetical protein
MYELNYYFAIFLGLAIGLFAGLCYFLTSLMRREYRRPRQCFVSDRQHATGADPVYVRL